MNHSSLLESGAAGALHDAFRDLLTSRRWQTRLLVLADVVGAGVAVWAGFELAPGYAPGRARMDLHPTVWGAIPLVALCHVGFAFLWGLYDADRLKRPMSCLVPTIMAAACAIGTTVGVQYLLFYTPIGRRIAFIAFLLLVWSSAGVRALLARVRRGVVKRVVFIGRDEGTSHRNLADLCREIKDTHVVRIINSEVEGPSVRGDHLAELEEVCATHHVDLIIVHDDCAQRVTSYLMRAAPANAVVTGLAAYYEHKRQRVPCELIGAEWLLTANHLLLSPMARGVKRCVDIVCAIAGLAVALPLWPAVALLIKASSAGPVFYTQERVGRHGRPFAIIKFRTMRVAAEPNGEAEYAKPKDPRVTFVGKILRRLRFDETPQFFNVLKGEMSFVGPRPERPEFVAHFRSSIPFYDIRELVKPGITGWAQIMHRYAAGEADTRIKLSYDLYYVKNGCFLLDVEIILRTLRALMKGAR